MGDTGDNHSLPCKELSQSSQILPVILWTVRILYTINSSPQYILARSHKKVPVQLVRRQSKLSFHYNSIQAATTSTPEESQDLYATASLKACLDAICCSR